MRSPSFRCVPFARDVALDPGRASAPRIAVPHMLPSSEGKPSAPAMSDLSWLNPTPHAIAVYASRPLSPVAAQHSLPSGRYSLLGPDFHRLDRTSLRLAHSFDHLVGAQQELTSTQRQITLTSTFQNAITTLILGFPPSSVSSCTVTRITTLGFFARAFTHSRSIIFAFSTSVSRRCMNILRNKWPRG